MDFFKNLKPNTFLFVGGGLWFAGLLMLIVSALGMRTALEDAGAAVDGQSQPEVQVTVARTPLQEEHYARAAAVLKRLFPSLTVEASKEKIKIEAKDESQWKDFLNALAYVPMVDKQALWEIVDLCAGTQCGVMPYSAVVAGVEQEITTTGLQ